MIVLAIGDIVGEAGCAYVRSKLSELRREYNVDVVIANGENSAKGNGVTQKSARFMFDSGIDVVTTGNHVLKRQEICETLNERKGVIRPANYHPTAPGAGYYIYDGCRFKLCVISLQGIVYLQNLENPFDCMDRLLAEIDTKNIIVDFHAEATSEKLCMGHYLDGKVSAMLGTHTHVPTADARVLPGGTGYITDLGMCGGINSSLGVKMEIAIERMRTGLPVRFEEDPEDIRLCAVVLEIDEATGKCLWIKSLPWI